MTLHPKLAWATSAVLLLSACGSQVGAETADQASAVTVGGSALSPTQMARWSASCALCHIDGNGGAPRIGHAEEWAQRIQQGADVLLTHTIEGMANMPPLGYCMSCERDDFIALIDFMAEGAP
jgi:cytochrome c5